MANFHLILTLSYLIPNLYLFLRIWSLFIPRNRRLLYIIIYCIIFLIYPLSNLIERNNSGIVSDALVLISNYLLPFFLYLFLFVLVTDILLLINLVFRLVNGEKLRSWSVRRKVFLLILILSAAVVTAGVINFNTIRLSEFNISVPARSSKIASIKIAFVSDFHIQEGTPARFVRKFASEIAAIQPDLMLYGGDIVEGSRQDKKMKEFEDILMSIHAKSGIYGVLGNHEHYASQDKGSFFTRSGITILNDTSVVIAGSIILAGRNDEHFRGRKTIGSIMKQIPDTLPVIILDHRPTQITEVSKTKCDIQFSGHTHNGQLFPINIITRSVYPLSWGYRKIGNAHFFVSSGIRLWGPPVRTTGKSEIMIVNVRFR